MKANHARRVFMRSTALAGALSLCVFASAMAANGQTYQLDIPAQPLGDALREFARASGEPIVFKESLTAGRTSPALKGSYTSEQALELMLASAGLRVERAPSGVYMVQDPQGGSAVGGAGNDVDALIVTAQKREENIQDVPIAISAFSQEDLTTRQVAGGPDLMTQVPNMTFTKTNFSSYSIQIRGIGTQAISATTDPAVAVAFNNTPFIRNRFFEQEFYDLQRVEVLRGPQGTLYGRNATAGVVNIISAKPTFQFEAKASGDIANFKSSRLEGMVNVPLVEDKVALRLAGAWTKRDGYATNEITDNPIDGRDLWSTRLSLRFEPTDAISANLIWEHFEEDDDRLRSGKQTCKKHVVTKVGQYDVPYTGKFFASNGQYYQSGFSQGCERESLYSPDAFQTPNGLAIPYYYPLGSIFLPINRDVLDFDPYLSTVQSTDLRVIESTVDPEYRAKSDLVELQFSVDLSDQLTLTSETSYSTDFIFSSQDFNRFNTAPGAWQDTFPPDPTNYGRDNLLNDGVFCDPQIGCSDRLVGVDLSTAQSRQFSQELRLSSDFDGPFNFSLGTNFLRYDTEDKYYVFINALSLFAAISPYNRGDALSPYVPGVSNNSECLVDGHVPPPTGSVQNVTSCVYMDPNPIGSLNDEGHNYFLSRNPFKLISYAAFGEVYYNITDTLKLTGGLRWTVDKKEAPVIPSWILGSQTVGYPVAEVVEQKWSEPTGRVTLDWKPDLDFTDETLLYASYAHGYKAGGANPPRPGLVIYSALEGEIEATLNKSATHPKTFDPEFIDSFEVGAKNTMLDGRLTANLAAFYYDYKGYQISEIVDRSALNRNFDAKIWGVELEADWRPVDNLRLGFKGGYQKTRMADGSQAVDLMDRTAGRDDWVLVRPFPTAPSNCILPLYTIAGDDQLYTHGNPSGGIAGGCEIAYVMGRDPVTNLGYVADPQVDDGYVGKLGGFTNYKGFNPLDASQGHNNGEGFYKDLSGNELPNAPNYTATVTADYTLPLPNEWLMTLHSDFHWQSESWWRIFNDHEYNRLRDYYTVNLAAIFRNEDAGWNIMAYVKNVTDETAITGAFLNSDDSMLTTNVFLTEPRLYGVRVTKEWTGGSLLGGFGGRRDPDRPYRFTLEVGGQAQRHDAPNQALRPGFANAFSPALDIFGAAQAHDLDWGDGRDIKLSYRPGDGPWTVSAAARYGKTNGAGSRLRAEEANDPACGMAGAYEFLCAIYAATPPDSPQYKFNQSMAASSRPNWSEATASAREEHTFVDFAVGRDANIGRLSRSSLGVGLRYAQFESTTRMASDGIPDWDIVDGWFLKYPATHHRDVAALQADREFEGAGPTVSWAASYPLAGGEETGRVDLDWSVTGGVLFGTQTSSFSGTEDRSYYEVSGLSIPLAQWSAAKDVDPTTNVSVRRTRSATAPILELNLGLSYTIDRVSVGAGYRWERYFDVLDGGFPGGKDVDRTIDGPYFKIAVGFGG